MATVFYFSILQNMENSHIFRWDCYRWDNEIFTTHSEIKLRQPWTLWINFYGKMDEQNLRLKIYLLIVTYFKPTPFLFSCDKVLLKKGTICSCCHSYFARHSFFPPPDPTNTFSSYFPFRFPFLIFFPFLKEGAEKL